MGDDKPARTAQRAPQRVKRSSGPVFDFGDGDVVPIASLGSAKPATAQVDICFVFDTTGSMADKIHGLKESLVVLIGELDGLALDWRVTCVPFGDLKVPGDKIVDDLPFVAGSEAAIGQIRALPSFSGGSNSGESSIEAMFAALRKPFRDGAVPVLVLLTDDSAHIGVQTKPAHVFNALRDRGAICFAATTPEGYYKEWALGNGGTWVKIASSMNTSQILEVLKSMAPRIASTARAVHELAGGDVSSYLQLNQGDTP